MGFALLSFLIGDNQIFIISSLLASILLGFLIFNFPFGKIFLGDGGAYFIGFFIACIAVSIYVRNEGFSPWSCVLLCAYPITETIISIIRKVKDGHHPGYPDRLHLHMLFTEVFQEKYQKSFLMKNLETQQRV